MITQRVLRPLLGLLLPVTAIATWWIVSLNSASFFFPPLSAIWDRFVSAWVLGDARAEIFPTLGSLAVGYAAAVIIGVGLGTALALLPRVHKFVAPLIEFIRALPALALIPIFVIALGIGPNMKIGLVIFGAIWPILLNTLDGIRGQDATIRDTAGSYRLRPLDRLLFVTLPGASPQIVAGMRVALSLAVIIVVATEMVVSIEGIGNYLLRAQSAFDLIGMWSGLILMGILGFLLNVVFELLERRALRWYRGMNEGAQV